MKTRYFTKWACRLALALTIVFFLFSTTIPRDEWQQPVKVMEAAGIKPGMIIGEPGAGQGYFTLKLARQVGPTGKIYANDINRKELNILKRKIKKAGISNVVIIKGKITDPLFPKNQLNMVFMAYVLHDLEQPAAFLKNLKPSLKFNAPLVILERDPVKFTDNASHFWKKEKILEIVKSAGYRLDKTDTSFTRDNLYTFYPE